jgi:phenylpropionate dioxygenase-like ring-hydroxylating dioxygenase large terminal subunit
MKFLRNAWYVAAWADEVARGPIGRTLLGIPVVLFRDGAGTVRALRDRCPHRAAPLSRGKVVDGNLQCPYHGIEFDGEGRCVRNPHLAGPGGLRLRATSFPVLERYGACWIWMGDSSRADPARIPEDYAVFAKLAVVPGYTHVKADYRLIVDNLLDLSHAEYLHAETVGTPGASAAVQARLAAKPDAITVERTTRDLPPSPMLASVWTRSATVDKWSNITWRAAGNLLLDIGVTVPGGRREDGLHFPSAHLLTPETGTTTHYFWMNGRNFSMDDAALSARLQQQFARTFREEDAPIIEAAQRNLLIEGEDAELANFTVGDAGSARARRMLDDLIAAQG